MTHDPKKSLRNLMKERKVSFSELRKRAGKRHRPDRPGQQERIVEVGTDVGFTWSSHALLRYHQRLGNYDPTVQKITPGEADRLARLDAPGSSTRAEINEALRNPPPDLPDEGFDDDTVFRRWVRIEVRGSTGVPVQVRLAVEDLRPQEARRLMVEGFSGRKPECVLVVITICEPVLHG